MRILLLALFFLYTTSLVPAELPKPTYKKNYSPEQLTLLNAIQVQWDTWEPNIHVKHWKLMEEGIAYGLHPDDISNIFLVSILQDQYPGNDPHEAVLHKVEFLLQHNADPNCLTTHNGLTTSLCMAKTIAIARCLIDHKAQLHTVSKENYTLLHHLVNRDYYKTENPKNLIALFCYAGVRPDERTSNGLTPLALLTRKVVQYVDCDHDSVLADTLVKVGTPIDEAFEQGCTQRKINTIDAIQSAAHNAQKEVAAIKEKLQSQHTNLINELLDLTKLSKDTARIVADYTCNLNPHDYFIQKILADADAKLQKERAEREAARETSRCIIQ